MNNNKLKIMIGGSANDQNRAIDALNIAAQHAPSSDLLPTRNLAHATRDEEVLQGSLSKYVNSPTGKTPLMAAAHFGNVEHVKTLLRSGLDPRQRDNTYKTAMHYALNEDVVYALWEGGALIEDYDLPPLYYACENNRESAVIGLIVCGADVNYNTNKIRRDGRHNCALDIAVAKGYNNIVSILLTVGADVNNMKRQYNLNKEINRDNLVAIHIAAMSGNVDVLFNLVAHGANINQRYTKLTYGYHPPSPIFMGNIDIVKLLLDLGAETKFNDKSILDVAIDRCDLDLIKLLLNHGIEINLDTINDRISECSPEFKNNLSDYFISKGISCFISNGVIRFL